MYTLLLTTHPVPSGLPKASKLHKAREASASQMKAHHPGILSHSESFLISNGEPPYTLRTGSCTIRPNIPVCHTLAHAYTRVAHKSAHPRPNDRSIFYAERCGDTYVSPERPTNADCGDANDRRLIVCGVNNHRTVVCLALERLVVEKVLPSTAELPST